MKCSNDLLNSLFERWISEAEPEAAQANVREDGIGPDGFGQRARYDKSSGRRGNAPHAQWEVGQSSERAGELTRPDRIVVDGEISAAGFAVLGQVHQRARAVLDVN